MKITITFKHLEHTEALDDKIRKKSQKFKKFFSNDEVHIKWTCFLKDKQQFSEVELIGPRDRYHAIAHSDNLYKTFDMVINKVLRQVSKKRKSQKNRIHRRIKEPQILETESTWTDYEGEDNKKYRNAM